MAKRQSLPYLLGALALAAVTTYFGFGNAETPHEQQQVATSTQPKSHERTAEPKGKQQSDRVKPGNTFDNQAQPDRNSKQSSKQPGDQYSPNNDFDLCYTKDLPAQAHETIKDILAGGPYEYPNNDNQRFGNYEGVLPRERGVSYREYTVETPGSSHRGARRIVTGGGSETDPDTWYYTDDHYGSFCIIPDAEQ
ncbi:ribonuclease domain-containing protein [Corynebacterium sp. HS2168-gen11]|uniref:ribonuclease domain-containing protein n=1 Tax=Corynebacterium sp. HS2168-gen11 TaxID=2974027 RepID=UPI00216B4632|nr:ribonuclease domain-containing protein [Corynebacterium sp. HS2168-gen11]MCS4535412.1 ribonuclease [Corynebacterium sp. HS2168-gen11]